MLNFLCTFFLHYLGELNENLSSNILYLMSFTFKLAKQKMTSKITSFLFFVKKIQEMYVLFVSIKMIYIWPTNIIWLSPAHKGTRFWESEFARKKCVPHQKLRSIVINQHKTLILYLHENRVWSKFDLIDCNINKLHSQRDFSVDLDALCTFYEILAYVKQNDNQ